MRLKGYVGSSDTPDTVCLYLSIDFDTSLYIKKSDILHVQEAPEGELEFGGTYIWVRKDAEITHVRTESTKEKASFLEGEIAQAQIKPSDRAFGPGQGMPGPITFNICPSRIIQCQPSYIVLCHHTITPTIGICCISTVSLCCPTSFGYCEPSHFVLCPPSKWGGICPTKPIFCQHSIIAICPSTNRICPSSPIICQQASGAAICEVESAACPDPVINPQDPIVDLTTQIKELVDQVKAQNAQLRKLSEKDTSG